MPIVVEGQPTFIIPVFQVTGYTVQYKPFASFYAWSDFLDLSDLDARMTAIEASIPADLAATLADLQTNVSSALGEAENAQASADAAQATANTALTNAGTAYGAALAAQTSAAAAQATANAALPATSYDEIFPTTCLVMADQLIYTVGTKGLSVVTAAPYNILVFTTTDLAAANYFVDLRKGTWTFVFWAVKRPDAGKTIVSIGSVVLSNPLDLYLSTTDYFSMTTYTGKTIPTSGRYSFTLTGNGKNGSSSGFVVAPIKFYGYRTGA